MLTCVFGFLVSAPSQPITSPGRQYVQLHVQQLPTGWTGRDAWGPYKNALEKAGAFPLKLQHMRAPCRSTWGSI